MKGKLSISANQSSILPTLFEPNNIQEIGQVSIKIPTKNNHTKAAMSPINLFNIFISPYRTFANGAIPKETLITQSSLGTL